jgi:hypothetical protein
VNGVFRASLDDTAVVKRVGTSGLAEAPVPGLMPPNTTRKVETSSSGFNRCLATIFQGGSSVAEDTSDEVCAAAELAANTSINTTYTARPCIISRERSNTPARASGARKTATLLPSRPA